MIARAAALVLLLLLGGGGIYQGCIATATPGDGVIQAVCWL